MLLGGREWYSHVGEHLYELAVFALQPSLWQTIPGDESNNNGSNKTTGGLCAGSKGTEAIGLTVSIDGLATLASKVSRLCYDEFWDRREVIEQFIFEISSLASILEPLSTAAGGGNISQIPYSDSMSQLVHQCTEMLEQLQGEIQCQQSDSGTRKFLGYSGISDIWPFTKKDTRNRMQKIKRLKSTVALKPM